VTLYNNSYGDPYCDGMAEGSKTSMWVEKGPPRDSETWCWNEEVAKAVSLCELGSIFVISHC